MSRWLNPPAAVVGVLLVAVIAYYPTVLTLHRDWTSLQIRDGAHGYLVAAACVWLLWDRRAELKAAPVKPAPALLVVVLALGAAWLVAFRANIQILHIVLLPPIVLAALWAGLGWPVARLAAFPLGYLYFATSIWEAVNGTLHALTVRAVTLMLRTTNVPAAIEGDFVFLSVGAFEIASGCSGLHYFVIGLAIAALYGEMMRLALPARIKVAALMVALAMIANWVRIYVVVLLGHFTKMKHYLVAVDHYWFGWGLFAACVVLFFVLARRIEAAGVSSPRQVPPVIRPRRNAPVAYLAALGALVVVPALAAWLHVEPGKAILLTLPPARESWSGPAEPIAPDWRPEFRGAHASVLGEYEDRYARRVQVYIAAYTMQKQGAELIGYSSRIAGNGGLTMGAEQVRDIGDISVRESQLLRNTVPQAVIWWVYDIGGRDLITPLAAQIWYGVRALRSAPISSVRIYHSRCEPDCTVARAALESFVKAMDPAIKSAIGSLK